MIVQLRQVLGNEHFDDGLVFFEPWQSNLINVSKLAAFDQFDEEPEGQRRRAMHQQLADEEVHTLHVIGLVIVAGEGSQY